MKSKYFLAAAFAAGALCAPPETSAASIVNNLVVHLAFDGDYNNTAAGSSVVASPVGSLDFQSGRIGSGAIHVSTIAAQSVFNYVTLGAAPELTFGGTTDLSVSFWAKVASVTADPSFISNKDWNSGDNTGWVVASDAGRKIQWNFKESGSARADYDGPDIFADGNWHNVLVSWDRDGLASTYIDGALVNSANIGPASDTLDTAFPTNIGQDGTGHYVDSGASIDALIDDVAVWRRALDAADAAGIYRSGTNGISVLNVPDPAHPFLMSVSPGNGEIDVRTDRALTAIIRDGAQPLDSASVQLTLNGVAATVVQSKDGIYTTLTHTPPVPYSNKTVYTARLIYGDAGTRFTNTWQFTTVGADQYPGITGQWDFDSGNLAATIGVPLEYFGGPAGPTAAATQFGTTTSFGIPDINGVPAKVLRFPGATTRQLGYVMTHGAVPNGTPTATLVNQWTIVFDVLMGENNKWFSYMQIDDLSNSNDGELFKNPSGGIGISGSYHGTIGALEWHRVVFALDMTGAAPVISKFIDGIKVNDQARTAPQTDGRHSLRPTALLFCDEDGESQIAYVNSIQVRNYKMSDSEVTALGGPSADGVPVVSGQWDFNEGVNSFTDGLKATIGSNLQFLPGTEFGTTFESVPLNDGNANVMRFGAVSPTDGYLMFHGGLPNAGGLRVNKYSVILDLMYPSTSTGFRSIWQTDTNLPTSDGDVFVNDGNGLGISSQYQGKITPDVWHRIALTFDLTKRELGKYIDGTNVLTGPVGSSPLGTGPFQYLSASTGVVDNRWSLTPAAQLFSDEDNEIAPVYVNSVQFRPVTLSADDVRRLGKPTSEGIPLQIPADLSIHTFKQNDFTYTLKWGGGKPPYQVQIRTSLSSGNWEDYKLPTTDSTLEIELIDIDGPTAFFRVIGQ